MAVIYGIFAIAGAVVVPHSSYPIVLAILALAAATLSRNEAPDA